MAKKFEFRLETILKLRTHKAQAAKEDLQKAVGLRTRKEQEIEDTTNYLLGLRNAGFGLVKSDELRAMDDHKRHVERTIEEMKKELSRLLEIEAAKRIVLNNAMREQKIMEKLKEKKFETYKFELNREESQELDAIGIARYAARSSGDESNFV